MTCAYTENRRVNFGNKVVGDGNPCFITFEAGPTHNGFHSAKNLDMKKISQF